MSDDKKVIFSMHKVNKVTPAGKQILRDVTLGFYHGAKIGILGANGAGKSTMLKILSSTISSTSGKVAFPSNVTMSYLLQDIDIA